VEAARMLGTWSVPPRRDRITGTTQNIARRDGAAAANALRRHLAGMLAGSDELREESARAAAGLGVKEIGPTLFQLLIAAQAAPGARVQALEALDALGDPQLEKAIQVALKDSQASVRNAGRRVLAKRQPALAVAELRTALQHGQVTEQQTALALLGKVPDPAADVILCDWLDRLLQNKVPGEVQLELLEAARQRSTPRVQEKLARCEASRQKNDPLADYREALLGGDAGTGRDIFLNKTEVACLRCHKVRGEGGEVGPDLTGIGAKQNREYLLESIVDPNRQIAKGFETVVLSLQNGTFRSGVLKAETPAEVRLITAEGQIVKVPKSQIESRETGKSAMPADVMKHLSKRELRDLVEFLANLK
jgi:quinoprotein glucose dehydrogenase